MSNGGGSLINLGDISKPATVLIEKISEAIGGVFKPYQIRRVAQAEAEAEKIREIARIEVTDLQRRAMQRFIHEEEKKQANIESITRLALPELSQDAKPQDVQNDWITNFFDKCRLISDGEMQSLWAKVLAGEANTPGKYSKRAVAVLSSLDKSDAELFRKLCSFGWCFGPVHVIPLVYDAGADIYAKAGLNFMGLSHLNDIGLIRFDNFSGFKSKGLRKKLAVSYYGTTMIVEFPKPEGNEFILGCVLLSKAGEELAPLCDAEPHPGFLDYIVETWRKRGLKGEAGKAEAGPVNGAAAMQVTD